VRRIGLAVSDPTRTIAAPLTTFTRREGKRPPWPDISRLIAELEIDEIVIGLPLDLSGEENAWAAEVREFGREVARRTRLPVHWVDERLTSVAAERAVRALGLKRKEREEKARVDAAAAALVLRQHLAIAQRGSTDVA
jgi:putative holliday junction resolvase